MLTESPSMALDALYRELVENIQEYAVFLLDPTGKVMTWNPGAERIKGYSTDEIVGRGFEVFYPEEARAAGRPAEILRVAAREGRFEETGWRVRKDGSRFWANVVLTPVIDRNGVLRGYAKVTRDLTERKRLEDQRTALEVMTIEALAARRDAEVAEAALRARDEFLSVAAHELKTPMTSVSLAAQMLRRSFGSTRPEQRQERALDMVDRQVAKLGRLVVQLLETVRMQSGTFTLRSEETDLAALVNVVVEDMRPLSERHVIVVDAPEHLAAFVDPLRVEQVLINLLDNAMKFMPDGGPIDVTLTREAGTAVLVVRDRGIGVPPEHRARLFDRFYQAHPDRSGMGLGLFIVRQIVERHGGTIRLESPPDGGTRFVVELPLESGAPSRS